MNLTYLLENNLQHFSQILSKQENEGLKDKRKVQKQLQKFYKHLLTIKRRKTSLEGLQKNCYRLFMQDIKAGVYQHYKGKFYLALGLARHSETEEIFVLYVPLYASRGVRMFVRPQEMFFEEVVVNGKKQPRFAYIGPEMPENIKEI